MIRAHITIIKDLEGKLSIAAISDNPAIAQKAFKDFNGDGEVAYFKVHGSSKKCGKAVFKPVFQDSNKPKRGRPPKEEH